MGELDRAAISVRLQQSREEAGLTQPEIGELLRVHWRTVQDWESPKKRNVPFDRLDEWAAITGTAKQWLLHGDEPTRQDRDDEAREVLDRLDRIEQALRRLLDERTDSAP